jgi:hypothetical protein
VEEIMFFSRHTLEAGARGLFLVSTILYSLICLGMCLFLCAALPWLGFIRYDGVPINLQAWVLLIFVVSFPIIALLSLKAAHRHFDTHHLHQMILTDLCPLFWVLLWYSLNVLVATTRPAGWYPIFQ